MRTSTLLLVGRNKLSRVGLNSLFTSSPFTVVGEISDLSQLDPDVLPEPDIALVDCAHGSGPVLDLLERLRAVYPDMPTVILSDYVSMATLAACLSAGAAGYLTTDISRDALLRSLQLAALGEKVFPTDLAGLLVDGSRGRRRPLVRSERVCGLSGREIETLQCLIQGDSEQGDRQAPQHHRGDNQGARQKRHAEDQGQQPDAGGDLGGRPGLPAGARCRAAW